MKENKHTRLHVYYTVTSSYEVDFDLTTVNDWYVKWGILCIQPKSGDDYLKIEPVFDGEQDDIDAFKEPNDFSLEVCSDVCNSLDFGNN